MAIPNHFKLKSDTPENLGIPPEGILAFIEHLERRKLCMHSVMILRHGKIAAEAHYPPFTADTLHRMYSTSKTFVSMAIGIMIGEGKITLRSRMADFFPEYLPENVHPFIAEMTVRDLLLMATPYDDSTYTVKDAQWVKTFFNKKLSHAGGGVFLYDTSGTVALNALVEKLSGQSLVEYLRPRLLDPLGFSPDVWCVQRPEGGDWGGSGLECSAADLAKFGLFLLNRGNWQGKQLVPEWYMREACSPLIDNRVSTGSSEFHFGYGYQIWMTRYGGFCTNGMGSQHAFCLPEKDLLLVTTGDTQSIPNGSDMILDSFWNDVYRHVSDGKLEANPSVRAMLKTKLENTEFPAVDGASHSPHEDELNGKVFILDANPMKIEKIAFVFKNGKIESGKIESGKIEGGELEGDEGVIKYINSSGDHELRFGLGRYSTGVFPETYYFGKKIGVPLGKGYRYKASAGWFNSRSLSIYIYIIDDYLGTLKINFW